MNIVLNGVYERIITYRKIKNGEKVQGDLAEFIKLNLDKWAKVANREFALEKTRQVIVLMGQKMKRKILKKHSSIGKWILKMKTQLSRF